LEFGIVGLTLNTNAKQLKYNNKEKE